MSIQLRRFTPARTDVAFDDDAPPQERAYMSFWVEADDGVHVQTVQADVPLATWDAATDQDTLAEQVYTALEHYATELTTRLARAAASYAAAGGSS